MEFSTFWKENVLFVHKNKMFIQLENLIFSFRLKIVMIIIFLKVLFLKKTRY